MLPEQALACFRESVGKGEQSEAEWNRRFSAYAQKFPDLAREFEEVMRGELPKGWDAAIPDFPADAKGVATRAASGKILNAIAPKLADVDRRLGGFESVNVHRACRIWAILKVPRETLATAKARRAADIAMPDAIYISACVSTAWRRLSTAWRPTAASFLSARRS